MRVSVSCQHGVYVCTMQITGSYLGSSEACFLRGQCFCAKYLMKNFLHSYQNSSSMCEEIPLNLVKEVFTAINIFTTNQLFQLATDVLSIILSGFILQSSQVAHTDSKNKTTGRVVSLCKIQHCIGIQIIIIHIEWVYVSSRRIMKNSPRYLPSITFVTSQ